MICSRMDNSMLTRVLIDYGCSDHFDDLRLPLEIEVSMNIATQVDALTFEFLNGEDTQSNGENQVTFTPLKNTKNE